MSWLECLIKSGMLYVLSTISSLKIVFKESIAKQRALRRAVKHHTVLSETTAKKRYVRVL